MEYFFLGQSMVQYKELYYIFLYIDVSDYNYMGQVYITIYGDENMGKDVMKLIETVVLAGGSSRRFRKNKLAFEYRGKPLICETIMPFYDISDHITIVTGQYPLPDLSEWFDVTKISIVHNPNHEDGMFTSVLKGVERIKGDCFLIPGDMPLVNRSTLQIVLEANGLIRVPVYQNRRGHPIFIAQKLISKLQQESPSSNLKEFRDRHDVTYLEVDDPGILQDIDTIEDAKQFLSEREYKHED